MNNITSEQMEQANMIRTSEIGVEFAVPVIYNKSFTFMWKTIFELEDSDYDRINKYFKNGKRN